MQPCPQCAKTAFTTPVSDTRTVPQVYRVLCTNCGYVGPDAATEVIAVQGWG